LSVAGYFHDPALVSGLTPFRITGRTQQEVWSSLGEYDLRPRLGGVALPALVVHGVGDPIPIDASRELSRLIRAPLVELSRCGHVPHVEAPESFTAALHGFLPRDG